jgi:hypothetical protein
MPCRWGGPHNRWVAIIGEWRSGFGNVASMSGMREGLVIVVLAPTGSHRCTSTTLAGYGPGSEARWRVCQRGTGRRGARHHPRYRGRRAGAALRCRHQLIALAAGQARAAG